MPYLDVAPPDWDALLGGSTESAWIADRNRKFGLAAEMAARVLAVAAELDERDLLFQCTPDALQVTPFAADWYVSLAGFSLNTLQNITVGPANFGLERKAKGLVERLRAGRGAPEEQLKALSDWINSEIDNLYPPDERDRSTALAIVFQILGGRVVGRGQNIGGEDAVDLVKSLLVEAFEQRDRLVEVELADGSWEEYRPEHVLPERARLRIGKRITCEFITGGDRPDIVILRDRVTVAVGEIKGRKDTSNVWESWMPGVYSHMRTWTGENPDAARLFFGTLINEAIVEGASSHGTERVGLKTLHKQGLLTAAYNISKIADNDERALEQFDDLVGALDSLIGSEL